MRDARRASMNLLAVIALTTTVSITSAAGTAQADDDDDSPPPPQCADLGLMGIPVDGVPVPGRYGLPGDPEVFVDVSDVRNSGRVLDWTSNFGIDQVIVTGVESDDDDDDDDDVRFVSRIDVTDDARQGTGLTAPGTSPPSRMRAKRSWCAYQSATRTSAR